MTYFTADWHFCHTNILNLVETRKIFKTIEEMASEIVNRCNQMVKEKDTLWILGDVTLVQAKWVIPLLKEIKCKQKHLIEGNHDWRLLKSDEAKKEFVSIQSLVNTKFEGRDFVLCHYPLRTWNKKHYGAVHLHGHCHGAYIPAPDELSMDVGVDCHNFYPISLTDVLKHMDAKADDTILQQ